MQKNNRNLYIFALNIELIFFFDHFLFLFILRYADWVPLGLDSTISLPAYHHVLPSHNTQVPGKASAADLRAMALQQQQQIEAQHQLLAAKEQRLRFLRAQEIRGAAVAAEGERLRRLRERVQAQESKLRRLRALRGQADLQKSYNVTLSKLRIICSFLSYVHSISIAAAAFCPIFSATTRRNYRPNNTDKYPQNKNEIAFSQTCLINYAYILDDVRSFCFVFCFFFLYFFVAPFVV